MGFLALGLGVWHLPAASHSDAYTPGALAIGSGGTLTRQPQTNTRHTGDLVLIVGAAIEQRSGDHSFLIRIDTNIGANTFGVVPRDKLDIVCAVIYAGSTRGLPRLERLTREIVGALGFTFCG